MAPDAATEKQLRPSMCSTRDVMQESVKDRCREDRIMGKDRRPSGIGELTTGRQPDPLLNCRQSEEHS